MYKSCFFIPFLLTLNSAQAQWTQDWVNDFCCFDSFPPHTFSYPMGINSTHDTLHIAFFEDGFLTLKKIDAANGNEIFSVIDDQDTIESPFYFGGGTLFLQNSLISSAFKYNMMTGQGRCWISSFDNNLNSLWNQEFGLQGGRISKPVADANGTAFFLSSISDSIRIYKIQISGNALWENAIPKMNSSPNQLPQVYINSSGQIVVLTETVDSINFDSKIRLNQFDPQNGFLLADSLLNDSAGTNFVFTQVQDTLNIAFVNSTTHRISLLKVDLNTMQIHQKIATALPGFTTLTKFTVDTTTGIRYLKTNNSVLAFSTDDSLIFQTTISSSTYEEYSYGGFDFDSGGHLLLTYSFFNSGNTPGNTDLKSIRMDKANGAIIDEQDYNSIRNTADIFLNQFLLDGFYYVIYASNFDNFAILNEETQLGIIRYSSSGQEIAEQKSNSDLWQVFPNPVENVLTFVFPAGYSFLNIVLKNLFGEKIAEIKAVSEPSHLDMSPYPAGIYILESVSQDQFFRKKIIKIK